MDSSDCRIYFRSIILGLVIPAYFLPNDISSRWLTSWTGFPISFGIFQSYYSAQPEFAALAANIALIGIIAEALYYLGAPFSAAITKKVSKHQQQQIWVGWLICIVVLLTASYTAFVSGLIATKGILYGLGFVILIYPIIIMLNEWWITRKGMAFGLISASSGATGAVMPFILTAQLEKYSYHITLRTCAVAMIIITAPFILLLKR